MTLPDTGRIREQAADAAYALGWTVVRKMPERAARTLFTALADRTWQQRGRGVRQLEKNLCRVLGKDAVDEEVRRLSRRAMRSYMRYWLEVFRLPEIGPERILADMVVSGHDKLFATLDSGRGAVIALPHMGNYEQAGAWVALHGYKFTTVAERLRPESLFDRFVAFRESLGFEVLPLGDGSGAMVFGTLARRLRAGRLVALVADRDLTAGGLEVEFFGRPARMPAGPAALAVQTGAALYPVTLWYEGRRWAARVHDQIAVPDAGGRKDKIRAMTQELALAFQRGIAEHPEDWHMLQRVWVEDLS
ncbi:phosphatidylinositol mannoside acyltransferase [Thermomonospora cellulosilytica]|uniref:KDO2-lipid IV(A) lauroyltransferase n=1 Tax=Thermomonospora cellulosilytica TaxID=1411118 RepID=A0A7W3R9X1_9ACTN|nr:phosphatidylinositol mannoside acyltransferase [Thermomonospora cellulosilytica]MBA9005099.1 KDO2-lipid IV(A) lauroyltransferase [Thermomonospora cellulosilytica]